MGQRLGHCRVASIADDAFWGPGQHTKATTGQSSGLSRASGSWHAVGVVAGGGGVATFSVLG